MCEKQITRPHTTKEGKTELNPDSNRGFLALFPTAWEQLTSCRWLVTVFV